MDSTIPPARPTIPAVLYFNLHTKAHTYYGEMRGQIYAAKE